jgi:asparagine synthase (glutamine-hydrolysing)
MCGIAGWTDYKNDLRTHPFGEAAKKMSESLVPRGPDEGSLWRSENCLLVHRRLIVVDPENGRQPMNFSRGAEKYTLCYNGELYNTDEIRLELKKRGYGFAGHSDTEVLIAAYAEWGSDCLEHLNGIFAFAVWEAHTHRLFIARDRAGVKPLFFYEYDGGIVFASEIKTLFASGKVPPALDCSGIAEIALLGPGRLCSSGVYKNVKSLRPGEYAVFSQDYGLRKTTYWKPSARPHTENIEDTARHLKVLIFDAIEKQLVSDVPLCTFLSGGLDSSIISTISARKYEDAGETLTTYSVDYKGNREYFKPGLFQPDEDAPWIQRMSAYIKSQHINVEIDTPDLAKALENAALARDLPGMADVDSSLLLFCREVKKNFTVALSGECADEIFGGYPWYHNEEMLNSKAFPWANNTEWRFSLLKKGILGSVTADEFMTAARNDILSLTEYLETDSEKDMRMREMFMLNFYGFMQTLLERKDIK